MNRAEALLGWRHEPALCLTGIRSVGGVVTVQHGEVP